MLVVIFNDLSVCFCSYKFPRCQALEEEATLALGPRLTWTTTPTSVTPTTPLIRATPRATLALEPRLTLTTTPTSATLTTQDTRNPAKDENEELTFNLRKCSIAVVNINC